MLLCTAKFDHGTLGEGGPRHAEQCSVQGQDTRGGLLGLTGDDLDRSPKCCEELQGLDTNHPRRSQHRADPSQSIGTGEILEVERSHQESAVVVAAGNDKD